MKKTFITLAIVAALGACSDSDNTPTATTVDDPIVPQTSGEPQTPGVPTGSLSSRLTTDLDEEGYPNSLWSCFDQNEVLTVQFIFLTDGTGQLTQDENAVEGVDFTWSETAGNSVLMSVNTEGDSQLQLITFGEDGSFSTTDSSIAGTTPGPLLCVFEDLTGEPGAGAGEGAPQVPGGPVLAPGEEALNEAVAEALNEADGSESSVAVIAANLVTATSEVWQCTSSDGRSLSLSFGSNGSGSLAGTLGSASYAWTTTEAPGLVVMSVETPNDAAVAGISFNGADAFSANLVRFSNPVSITLNGGRTSCVRGA